MKSFALLYPTLCSALVAMQAFASVIQPATGLADLSSENQTVHALNHSALPRRNWPLTSHPNPGCERAFGITACPPGDLRDEWGCHPRVKDYEDAHHDLILRYINRFCRDDVPTGEQRRPFSYSKTYPAPYKAPKGHEVSDIVTITVSDHGSCGPKEHLDVFDPKVDYNHRDYQECINLVFGAWRGCTGNQGRGGWLVSGCVKYEVSLVY